MDIKPRGLIKFGIFERLILNTALRYITLIILLSFTTSTYSQGYIKKRYKIKLTKNDKFFYSKGEKTKNTSVKNISIEPDGTLKGEVDTKENFKEKKVSILLCPELNKADIFQKDGQLQVYFWPLDKDGDSIIQSFEEVENDGGYYFYKIENRKPLELDYRGMVYGPITIPFKYYLGSNDDENSAGNLTANINIGTRLGYILKAKEKFYYYANQKKSLFTEHSINVLLNTSFVPLKNENTEPDIGNSSNTIMPSVGLAYILSLNGFELIFGSGFDIPLGNNAKTWIYKGHPWIGFGLGYKIL